MLVLGGCRSGKSRYAQERCEAVGNGSLAYIATAQAFDAEMEERIARHRIERGSRWLTIDAPMDLPAALSEAACRAEAILVDCLTLWLTNLKRSEEHTSELQSLMRISYAVLCLKKKKH